MNYQFQRVRYFFIVFFLLWTTACGSVGPIRTNIMETGKPNENPEGTKLPPTLLTPGAMENLPVSTNVKEIVANLEGLPIDQFFEESFKILMLRDPESVTIEGLCERFGLRNDRLTNISDAYVRETHEVQKAILAILQSYDYYALTPEQQTSCDTYLWYLDDLVRLQEFMYNDYPVNQMYVLGVQYLTLALFTDYNTIQDKQDAQDYITRLGQVKRKFDQLIDGMKLRQEAGIIPPVLIIQFSLSDIQGIASSSPKSTPYYQALQEKVNAIENLSANERQELLDAAEKNIKSSVIPAYKDLANYLDGLQSKAGLANGVLKFSNGEAYYNYLIHHHTSTDMTADQIHQLGMSELKRIHEEMRAIFNTLDYPEEGSLTQLFNRVVSDYGTVQGNQILKSYEELIQRADQSLETVFDMRPNAKIVVASIPGGSAYYSSPAIDGSRPGTFYAPVQGYEPRFKMPTLAYHEGIPGHHFQISLAREMALPLFRNVLTFNAYAEGWALYAERLAKELGWYENDPYGDLGRLQMEAFRAARLVVDTGIHTKKWGFDQSVDFMVENTGLDQRYLQYEVGRYIAWPGQALSYDIGMLKILELRQKVMDKLGDGFDLKEFHHLILSNGSVPLEVLERLVDEFISLNSLSRIDEFPLYEMQFYGDYDFTSYLQTGEREAFHSSPRESLQDASYSVFDIFDGSIILPKALKMAEINIGDPGWACTCFSTLSEDGEMVFGRNFDWHPHPILILFTDPPDGYASVSMVDIFYLGIAGKEISDEMRPALLEAPFLPFDGMNDQGLAVGMMAVPHAEGGNDPRKLTITDLATIRLMLDYAGNVSEAIALLQDYNIDFGQGPPLHYQISDASGDSAVVEFLDGKPNIIRKFHPWQVSTNFLLSEEEPIGAKSSCWRYNEAYTALQEAGGKVSMTHAMLLLESLSQSGPHPTIWSVVYNMTSGKIQLVVGREYSSIYEFHLDK